MLRKIQDRVTGEPYYSEVSTGRQFRRTTCALSWPWAEEAGCVIVLGELRNPPTQLGARRHVHVLAELRSHKPHELLDTTERFQCLFLFQRLVTSGSDDRVVLLDDYNDTRRRERKPILRTTDPAAWHGKGEGMMPYYISLVQRRVEEEKSLFFGPDCAARDDVRRAGKGDLTRKMLEMPGVCALCWAVEEIDVNSLDEWHIRNRVRYSGPADALGGY